MKNVIKNYFYNAGYQILLIILPLVTTPYVSRVLGAENLGTYSYTNSITQYFILFGCIGLNLYGQREIAYYQNDQEKINRTFWELVVLRVITLSLSIVLFYFTFAQNKMYGYIFLIQILDILAALFDISWLFQGLEDFKRVVVRNFIVRVISVAMIFIFVKNINDLQLYVFIYSGVLLIGNISIWVCLPSYIRSIKGVQLQIKKHIVPALMLFLPQIATSLYTLLDKTMLGLLCNRNSEVAYYEQAQTIVKALTVLITSFGTAMMPRVANLYKNDNTNTVKKYLTLSLKFVYLSSFAFAFGISAISSGFVPWFYGAGFDKVILNIILMSPIIVFIGLSNVFGVQYLLPLGRQREYTISVVAGAILNFVLNIILIPFLYSRGAAIATIVAELSVVCIQMYYVRKDFKIREMLSGSLRYLLMGIAMYIVIIIEVQLFDVSIKSTIIEIFTGVLVYMILIFVSKDNVISMIKNKKIDIGESE